MSEAKDKYERLTFVSTHPKQLWCYKFTQHKNSNKGHFYLPVEEFPTLLDRILAEDWDTEDVLTNNKYEIFLRVNACYNDEIVKLYMDNTHYKWISVQTWQQYYADAEITEISVKPCYYKDEYNRNLIAGQLRFASIVPKNNISKLIIDNELNDDTETSSDTSTATPADLSSEVSVSAAPNLSKQLVGVITALGLTPKDAIKLLVDCL